MEGWGLFGDHDRRSGKTLGIDEFGGRKRVTPPPLLFPSSG